jgi:hypothetical protein
MTGTDVTRGGQVGVEPGRQAHVGSRPPGPAEPTGPASGRRHRYRADSQPTSYYGLPVLNRPVWSARDVAGYLFTGGLAGASAVVAAGAEATGRPVLARAAKLGAAGAITVSAGLLVHDLGRPERFHHMLRVFKPTSPMSVGSWILSVFGPAAGVAALTEVTGRFPRIGRAATAVAAGTGPAVAAYTAVLVADTAVPAWHEGYRELPYLFTGSATLAASGLGLICAPLAENGPVRRAALLGAAAELAAGRRLEGHGLVSEPYRTGRAGRLLKASRALVTAGAAGATLLGGRSRVAAAVSGALLLAGSACTRFGVFEAGMASADDPKYVLEPQRARLDAASPPRTPIS